MFHIFPRLDRSSAKVIDVRKPPCVIVSVADSLGVERFLAQEFAIIFRMNGVQHWPLMAARHADVMAHRRIFRLDGVLQQGERYHHTHIT
jgi:hypothetical protein